MTQVLRKDMCCASFPLLHVWTGSKQSLIPPPAPLLGDIKSSSPSESPLMEKRAVRESICPILKQTANEGSAPASAAATQTSAAQPQAAPEERRVAFDIGDSDEVDCSKERKVAFDIGDSDDTDYSLSNGGKLAK